MTERLLQFIWQLQYFNTTQLETTDGEALQIINPGQINNNQGPDFLQSSIKIAGTTWVGNIEVHTKSSLWNTHKHHEDSHYGNVILHVVWQNDAVINNPTAIPVLTLQDKTPKLLLQQYEALMHHTGIIPCENSAATVSLLTWTSWKERLAIERMERKAHSIRQNLTKTENHWEEIFWWLLARNFGVTVNSEAFECIARSISISILAKHKAQIHQLESLLFGQANLLQGRFTEDYPNMLTREYNFLRKKYKLQPINYPLLFLRMRPQNFPSIRLAQLAQLIHHSKHLFSSIKEATELNTVKKLLQVTANDYWHYHYRFDDMSPFKEKTLGQQMVNNIIINTIVPVLFSYGHLMKENRYTKKAMQWLMETPPEENTLTRKWTRLGVANESAMDSQALTELTREYCTYKNCLSCAIGNAILKKAT